MELVDEKHVDQCVSTEKADEITSAHDMKTELSEWFATHRGKKWESRGRKEGPLADPISFECAGGVRDKWMDVTVPNISVKVVVSRPQTLAFTKKHRKAPSFRAGIKGAPSNSFRRCVLLPDVLLDLFQRSSPATGGKVGRRP